MVYHRLELDDNLEVHSDVLVGAVMGPPGGPSWVCKADDEDDLREAVRAARELGKVCARAHILVRVVMLQLIVWGDVRARPCVFFFSTSSCSHSADTLLHLDFDDQLHLIASGTVKR